MKKKTAWIIVMASALFNAAAWLALLAGFIPTWLAEAVFVIAFPIFVLFLGLWWQASEGDEDVPFIGY
jgi:hypothetical protein